jgi:hypothetical protein
MAHARRRFVQAEQALPQSARCLEQPATQFVAAIGELYAIEANARELAPEARQRLRDQYSRPVLQRLKSLLQAHLHAVVPTTLLGKALHYLSEQWPRLVRFLEDGRLWRDDLDERRATNGMRGRVAAER